MWQFKFEQIVLSIGNWLDTGDREHLRDVWRIAVWQGSSAE